MLRVYTLQKRLAVLCAVLILLPLVSSVSSAPSDIFVNDEVNVAEGRYVPGQVVVKFKAGVSGQMMNEVIARHGCLKPYKSALTDTFVLEIPADEVVAGILKRFRGEPLVEYAQPNYVCKAFMTPNDPYYSYQWNFDMIHMEQAWDVASGGSPSVVVAVLDTGVAYENYGWRYKLAPDLAGTTFVSGYDFVNNDAHPNDDESHGTHVAGTIAQTTNNAIGVAGIAFNTAIMPVKVFNRKGDGTVQNIADGIVWAADHGADVISMSAGFDSSVTMDQIPTVTAAVEYAYSKGVVMVASSGNEGVGVVSLPAAYPEVIAVGAVHSGSERADYSQYGDALDFVAPGGDEVDRDGDGYMDGVLQNTFNPTSKNPSDFGYWFLTGTSMAAPHVSGVIALLIANGNADANRDGKTSLNEIMTVLQATAKDLGAAGRDNYYGYGLINASAALQSILPVVTGGSWNDGIRDRAQITVWNGENLAFEGDVGWYWTDNTTVNSVSLGDVDSDGVVEIVTGGSWNDGVNNHAQVTVWSGQTLAFEGDVGWLFMGDTVVNSIALADADGDSVVEIVTGGSWNDGIRDHAQITVWNGETLALESSSSWYFTGDTVVNSIALSDVDGDGVVEVVTGGSWNDGVRDNAQITVWNGETMAYERDVNWYWTDDTMINSIALADVDADGVVEIVTGGSWNDGVRNHAQITVWNGETMAYERDTGWYWTDDTIVNAVRLADIDGDSVIEIVTGGSWNDGLRNHAQVTVWSGETLAFEGDVGWFWTDDTVVNSVSLADVDGDGVVEIVTGGSWNDGVSDHAQVTVWDGETLAFEGDVGWFWTDDTVVNSVS